MYVYINIPDMCCCHDVIVKQECSGNADTIQ